MRNLSRLLVLSGIMATRAYASSADDMQWTQFGLRPLGMGNAFVAVADDYNAMWYNPAGLARLKEWHGEFFSPRVETSKETMSLFSDLMNLQSGSANNTSDVLDLFSQHLGKNEHFGLGVQPYLVFPHFGFGVAAELDANIVFHREVAATVDVGPRIIAPITFATSFLEDRLSVGATIKGVARYGIDNEFDITSIEAFSSSSSSSSGSTKSSTSDFIMGGYGVGADVGMLFTPIKPMEPTLGVSFMDIGGTPYKATGSGANALGAPPTRQPAVNAGLSLKPIQNPGNYVLTSMDVDCINQPISFSKKLNFGAEYGLGSILKFDLGLHQGYLSGGFQFDVGLLKLRAVTYEEELGPVAGEMGDRRYALQVKLLI